MKKLYFLFLMLVSFSTSVFSAPPFNSIFDSITDETIEIADNEYDEAMQLSDRANMPTKEMLEKAFKLYKSAAEKGHIFAMHNLARGYQNGKFTSINYDEAFEWYLNASKFGFAGSQNNLGDMYENGKGTKQSYTDAIYWYTQAAMQGEPTAYLSLGSIYKDGLVVQKNLVESAFWLTLAKANLNDGLNLQDAIASLNEITKNISSEQLKEVEIRARFFQPLRQTETKISDR